MASIYGILRKCWQFCPSCVKELKGIKRIKKNVHESTWKYAKYDELYDHKFYMGRSAEPYRIMADTIFNTLSPTSLIDVGCGSGELMNELKGRIGRLGGIEKSHAAIETCKNKGLEVAECDLTDKISLQACGAKDLSWDAVVCLEVAEHLPEPNAEILSNVVDELSFKRIHQA